MGKKLKFLSILLIPLLIFTGCTLSKKSEDDKKDKNDNVLYVYNWGDYIDPSLLKKFEAETGIKVKYDVFDTNEIMYQKISNGSLNYDLIIPSDYMVEKMIDENLLAELNFNNIPNYKYIDKNFRNLAYDKENKYSVPYMWGTVGIMYNKKMVKEPVDSLNILWDEKYKDQVIMVDSPRDAFALALKKLGYSLNTINPQELEAAKKELIKQKSSGLVRAYMVDEVKDAMLSGEAALAVVWSGDAITLMDENPDLGYAFPKEGSNKWFDALCIPKNAKHKESAEKFINFLCDPENAAINAEYIGYSTPNTEALKLLPKEVRENPVAYPDLSKLNNFEVFVDLGNDVNKEISQSWIEVKAAREK
ncbi:ABC transporter substrate-binding protein [Clostridium sp.]|uniref:ABC transporter substrate-binding protein n=1 Tax=Clostridium sp. TaxID=1506 RepID=UPI003992537F